MIRTKQGTGKGSVISYLMIAGLYSCLAAFAVAVIDR